MVSDDKDFISESSAVKRDVANVINISKFLSNLFRKSENWLGR